MSIPTYQVFNIDRESTETCGEGKSGYVRRTNYLLDSFRKREITNGKNINDEGERQYDGTYNLEQKTQQEQQIQYNPVNYREGFFDFKSLSPTLIVISVSCLLIFIYILYKIMLNKKK